MEAVLLKNKILLGRSGFFLNYAIWLVFAHNKNTNDTVHNHTEKTRILYILLTDKLRLSSRNMPENKNVQFSLYQ